MAVKNTLGDVHNLLMEQLERVSQASDEELEGEIKRSEAMTDLAQQMNANASNVIKAASLKARMGGAEPLPPMLGGGCGD